MAARDPGLLGGPYWCLVRAVGSWPLLGGSAGGAGEGESKPI